MDTEKMKILEMISNGKISAEEGSRLLDAMDSPNPSTPKNNAKKKWLRIKVTDLNTGKDEVNVNLPISFLNWGLKMGQHFSPELRAQGVDMDEIANLVNEGAEGKIVDVYDKEENKHVEISID